MRKNITLFLILLICFLSGTQIEAQNIISEKVWQWITTMGGPNWDYLNGLETDSEGNIYAGGSFVGTIALENFDLNGSGKQDIFVAKYNPNGKLEWVWSFGSSKSDKLTALKLTKSNDILISGIIAGEVELDGNSIPGDGSRLFIAKLNDRRDLLWIKTFPYKYPASIYKLFEFEDKIIIAGTFKKKLSVGNEFIRSKGKEDIFLARLSSIGELEKIETFGGYGRDIISDMHINNQGKIYLAVDYENNLEIGEQSVQANSKKSKNALIMAINIEFKSDWIKTFNSKEYIDINAIDSDDNNNLFIAGNFTHYVSCENYMQESNGDVDFFITKLDSFGKIKWFKNFGSKHKDVVSSIKAHHKAGILFHGFFNDTLLLDSLSLISNEGKSQTFVSQINTNGNILWAKIIAGENNFISQHTAFDEKGNLLISGNYRGKVDANDFSIKSNGKEDIYLVKYHNCIVLEEKLIQGNPYLCGDNYTELALNDNYENISWNDGLSDKRKLLIENPGKYFVKVRDEYNCSYSDSIEIIHTDLPVFNLGEDTTLTTDQTMELHGPENMDSYLWYNNLSDQNILIIAENNTDYRLEAWLRVTDSLNCEFTDTITIDFISNLTSTENSMFQEFNIYPNPASEYIHWEMTVDRTQDIRVKLVNINGQIAYSNIIYEYISGQEISIPVNDLPDGTYYLEIGTEHDKISKTVVIINQ